MANLLNWSRGHRGKGIVATDTGDVHTWNVGVQGTPHHDQYAQNQNIFRGHVPFFIDPDGHIHNDPFGPLDTATAGRAKLADPNLHSDPREDDDWSLAPEIPGAVTEGTDGPDYNFVLGSIGHHFHPYTGLPCNCKYGRPRHIRMARTAGVEWNRFKKQIGKKFWAIPNAQHYHDAMEHHLSPERDPEGQFDQLVPFLNKEFKAGRVSAGRNEDNGRPFLTRATTDQERQYNPEDDWRPFYNHQIGHMGQWAAARQHPTRRGVNLTAPDFTIHDALPRVSDFYQDMEEREERERMMELMQGTGRTIHEWPDGWHVRDITNPDDMDLEGEVMNHCIGNDGEHPHNGYSYKDAAGDGLINVYSLRDPDGLPHATWHTNPSGTLAEIHGNSNSELKPEYNDRVRDWLDRREVPYTSAYDGSISGYGDEWEPPNQYPDHYQLDPPESVEQFRDQHVNHEYEPHIHDEQAREGYYEDHTEVSPGEPNWSYIAPDFLEQVQGGWEDPESFIDEVAGANHHWLGDLEQNLNGLRDYHDEPLRPEREWNMEDPQGEGHLFDPGENVDHDGWEEWNDLRQQIKDALNYYRHPHDPERFMSPYEARQYHSPPKPRPAYQDLFEERMAPVPGRRHFDFEREYQYPLHDHDPNESVRYLPEELLRQRKGDETYKQMTNMFHAGYEPNQIRQYFPELSGYAPDQPTPTHDAWNQFLGWQHQQEPDRMPDQVDQQMLQRTLGVPQQQAQQDAMKGTIGQPQPAGGVYSHVEDTDYADELLQWLSDLQPQEAPAPLSPHHQSPLDIIPQPPVSPLNAPPYWPPGHVPDWADPSSEGRTSAKPPQPEFPDDETTTGGWLRDETEQLIEGEISPQEYDEALDEHVAQALAKSEKKPRGPWLSRLFRRLR